MAVSIYSCLVIGGGAGHGQLTLNLVCHWWSWSCITLPNLVCHRWRSWSLTTYSKPRVSLVVLVMYNLTLTSYVIGGGADHGQLTLTSYVIGGGAGHG